MKYVLLDKHISEENALPTQKGALIVRERYGENPVAKGSPADKAGLREYDIIISFNKKMISKETPLAELLGKAKIDQKVEISFLRKGKLFKKQVVLQEKR